MAFRVTPSLGPDVEQVGNPFYWDSAGPAGTLPAGVSYQLGVRVIGSDGADYILVTNANASALAPGVQVEIDDETFEATPGAGGWFVPDDLTGGLNGSGNVPPGSFFHARRPVIDAA